MPAKRFDFTPIPQPAAPARDEALTASSDGSRPLAGARTVPLERLVADPDQPRRTMNEEALRELADSLQAQGMRQPITAYYDDSRERFVVISGERRMRAAQRAGMTHVPVLVERRPTSETDKLVLQLAENLVREDLTAPEAARALARLKDLRPKDWLEVAARHGFGRRRAYQYLDLLDDPPPLRTAIDQGSIAAGHAEELRRVASDRLEPLLEEVITHGLSVADTRRLIAGDRRAQEQAEQAARSQPRPTAPTARPEPSTEAPSEAERAPRRGPTAGAVADTIQAAAAMPDEQAAASALSPGAALVEEKERRRRSRHLRARLERISSELRNMHLEEVTAELPNLPEIVVQARQAREHLDSFITLLERVQLDRADAADDVV